MARAQATPDSSAAGLTPESRVTESARKEAMCGT
jgi:hypothetical protein